ncbi:hypothetical protein PR048_030165 [Dryococelus australis]|uniref:Metallothionein n=1 Tax=Dryococelus australis TaxID=614101 RepID=A0ABQ9G862_9NEOP|nr:hypothetical protein PR048_030165 [Dryococelus australis]
MCKKKQYSEVCHCGTVRVETDEAARVESAADSASSAYPPTDAVFPSAATLYSAEHRNASRGCGVAVVVISKAETT